MGNIKSNDFKCKKCGTTMIETEDGISFARILIAFILLLAGFFLFAYLWNSETRLVGIILGGLISVCGFLLASEKRYILKCKKCGFVIDNFNRSKFKPPQNSSY